MTFPSSTNACEVVGDVVIGRDLCCEIKKISSERVFKDLRKFESKLEFQGLCKPIGQLGNVPLHLGKHLEPVL